MRSSVGDFREKEERRSDGTSVRTLTLPLRADHAVAGAYFLITPGPSGEAVTISRYENSPDELQAILSAACDELSAAPAEAAEPAEAAAPAGSSL